MKKPTRRDKSFSIALFIAASALVAIHGVADEAGSHPESLGEAFSQGQASINFRYRFEAVDQEGLSKDAEASTLRTRFSYSTAEFKDFGLLLDIGNVTVIGSERYNSTRNGETAFPVVADPEGSELNQLYVNYSPGPANIVLGRQRILRNNQRFVGDVAWRQNEQTFDSLTVSGEGTDWHVDYGYIWGVERIFGPDSGNPVEEFDSDSHIFDWRYSRSPAVDVRAYGYLLDLENAPSLSNQTYGVRLSGKAEVSRDRFLRYSVEYANQGDYADNPNDYSADYHLLEIGGGSDAFSILLGWEVLEGDPTRDNHQFLTPLATLHKFQGWADKFLTTPGSGIDDRYLAVNANMNGTSLAAVYHQFEAEAGGQDYGEEWNVSLARTFGNRHKVLLKYADYQADTFATDTTKWWLQYFVEFPQ